MHKNYDFCGWATKYGIRCSDGRTIDHGAFKDQDGKQIPLVWNHNHNSPNTVLGYAILEHRDEGMYAYGYFNETDSGKDAKELVRHGDIDSLSIYANRLQQNGANVKHGVLREVSLVYAGANPGAMIDSFMGHSDVSEDEAMIYTDETISLPQVEEVQEVAHSESIQNEPKTEENKVEQPIEHAASGKTVQDVWNEMTEEEQAVASFMLSEALKQSDGDDDGYASAPIEHAEGGKTVKDVWNAMSEEKQAVVTFLIAEALKNKNENNTKENPNMKHNAFDSESAVQEETHVLSHSEMEAIFDEAKQCGSLRAACKAHDVEDIDVLQHSITGIDYLFPDAKNVRNTPDFISRKMEWVSKVTDAARHIPFEKIKSTHANITADEARAKGFVKGNQKTEEVIVLLQRSTDAQMIYKKQAMDRDDMIAITDFDKVAWLKSEMRVMLDEELARAILISDGRSAASPDKIKEDRIRPIWTDSNVYVVNKNVEVAADATPDDVVNGFIEQTRRARKDYRGSGNLTLFTTEDFLTDMLLMKDDIGHFLYKDEAELAKVLRVSNIVTVPVMENQTRTVDGVTKTLLGICVNMNDYGIGTNRGGQVTMFDDFDIDYNKEKYLLETRVSGALLVPYSAIVIEKVVTEG